MWSCCNIYNWNAHPVEMGKGVGRDTGSSRTGAVGCRENYRMQHGF